MKSAGTVWTLIAMTMFWFTARTSGSVLSHSARDVQRAGHVNGDDDEYATVEWAPLVVGGRQPPFPRTFILYRASTAIPHRQFLLAAWMIAQSLSQLQLFAAPDNVGARLVDFNEEINFADIPTPVTLRMQVRPLVSNDQRQNRSPEPAVVSLGQANDMIGEAIRQMMQQFSATWGQVYINARGRPPAFILSWGLGHWAPGTGPAPPPPPSPSGNDETGTSRSDNAHFEGDESYSVTTTEPDDPEMPAEMSIFEPEEMCQRLKCTVAKLSLGK